MSPDIHAQFETIELSNPEQLEITYWRTGSGTPILFLCGGGTDVEFSFPFLNEMARDFEVYSFNYPGFMGSTAARGRVSQEYLTALVGDFTQRLGLDQYILIGHSMGGGIAIDHAINNPGAVKKLVLFSPVVGSDSDSTPAIFNKVTANHILSRQKDSAKFPRMSRLLFSNLKRSPNALDHIKLVQNYKLGNIGGLTMPILAIIGNQDIVTDPQKQQEVLKGIPGCQVVVVDDEGHDTYLLKLSEVADHVRKFVEL